jgi:hypothetical protein
LDRGRSARCESRPAPKRRRAKPHMLAGRDACTSLDLASFSSAAGEANWRRAHIRRPYATPPIRPGEVCRGRHPPRLCRPTQPRRSTPPPLAVTSAEESEINLAVRLRVSSLRTAPVCRLSCPPYPPQNRGRATRLIAESRAAHALAPAHTGLGSSPCMTTGYSPSSSDFEPISDSEVVHLNSAPSPLLPPAQAHPSNLSRTLSQRRRSREESYLSTDSVDSSCGSAQQPQPQARGAIAIAPSMDDERNQRGTEGDDEDSSAFEDVEGARGRARTRRIRDPELKKSMLEDALRSRSVSRNTSLINTSVGSL